MDDSWSPAKNVDEVFLTGLWVLGSLPLALRWSLLGSLCQQAAVRLAAFCRCGLWSLRRSAPFR